MYIIEMKNKQEMDKQDCLNSEIKG